MERVFNKMKEQQIQTGEVKKSRWWLWLIIALVVIGIGAYFLLSGGSGIGGSSIPSPPALPS